MHDKESSSNKQGELYAPEFALRIQNENSQGGKNTQVEKEEEGEEETVQGKLYSPNNAVHINVAQRERDNARVI